jgi:hypothetical protein
LTLEALEDRTLLSGGGVTTTTGLIAAINTANSSGGATTISLAAGASFDFTSPDNSTNGTNALPVITGNITIAGNYDIIARTTGPQEAFRLFDVARGGTLTLQNLTLQGGLARGPGGAVPGPVEDSEGGAIYSSGTLRLDGVTVKSNMAQGSSGFSGLLFMSGTNGGAAGGGGLFVAGGSVSVINSILSSNTVKGGNAGTGGNGGTIHSKGPGGPGGGGGHGGLAAGGGLFVAGGTVSLSNDTVSGNSAFGGNGGYGGNGYGQNPGGGGGVGGSAQGGGVNVSTGGNLTLLYDTFVDNAARGGVGGNGGNGIQEVNTQEEGTGDGGSGGSTAGGGVFVSGAGNYTVNDDTFSANVASGGLGGLGGANYKGGGGFAGQGGGGGDGHGGGLFTGGSIGLVNDTLNGNIAHGGDGSAGGVGAPGQSSIFGGTPGGNGGGGGVGGTGTGGGLYVVGSASLLNDTITGNIVDGGNGGNGGPAKGGGTSGAGGAGGASAGGGVDWLVANFNTFAANTIFAENFAGYSLGGLGGDGNNPGAEGAGGDATGPDVYGPVLVSDHNLIDNTSGSQGFSTADGDLLNVSPYLGPLQYNGGPTDTVGELAGSPTINAGDPTLTGLPSTDQRGYNRFGVNAAGQETIDIGAYEYGGNPPAAIGNLALSISGSGSSSTTPSGQITYTLLLSNTSSTAQSNVDVVDQLPANTTLVSWTAAAGWASGAPSAGSSSGTVSASVASLPANSSATFTLVVQVAAGTPVGTVIDNTASFGPFDETSNSGTNSASVNTPVLNAPTLQVADGGTYDGNPFPATATAVGIDGTTPVAGTFNYAYYAGSGTSGTSLGLTPPTNAGTYTVVATFTSSDADYASGGTAQTTFTISPAPISYTIGNDTQAYGYPANLVGDLPSSFSTGINGETLDIAYSSGGDTSTAPVGTYAITGVVSNGTGLASNYSITLTNGTLTVLGPGASVVGSTLWIVGGTTSNDNVQVSPTGSSTTGSTGVQVQATLNRVSTSTKYSQSFSMLDIFLYGGTDNVQLAPTLTLNATVSAGNGTDNVQLDGGNNTVSLGNGNDNIQAGGGSNTLTLGNGNDNVQVGNGNNVVVTGNGNDNIQAGNGDNLIAAGLGQHTVQVGNGSNILIDGGVQLTQSGDSLRQVLDDWILYGAGAANVASIRSRLSVTYNTHYANTLHAGSALDWFWATDTQDHLNVKKTDLLN